MEGFKFWKKPSAESSEKRSNERSRVMQVGAAVAVGAIGIQQGLENNIKNPESPTIKSEQVHNQTELEVSIRTDFEDVLAEHGLDASGGELALENIAPRGADGKILLTFIVKGEKVPVVFDLGDGVPEQIILFLKDQGVLQSK